MGQEIIYCGRCANRIAGADFERGRAFRVDGRGICADCASPEERQQAPAPSSSRAQSTTRIKTPKLAPGTSTRMPLPPPPPTRAPSTGLVAGLSAAAILVLGGAFWVFSSPSSGPAPVRPTVRPPDPVPPPEQKPEDPQIRQAREAMLAAREKVQSAPADLDAQRIAWEEAARVAALTPYFKEASAELQAVRERLAAAKAPEPLKPPDPAPLPPTPAPPTPVPPTPAAPSVSAAVWNAAMAKASARDFEGAAAEFRKETAGVAEAVDLEQAAGTLSGALGEIPQLPAGQPISVSVRSETGEVRKIEGTLQRAGTHRLEVRVGDELVFVELPDITAASLAALVKPSPPLRRRFALLCILEGDRGAAEQLAGADAFPPRTWDYAKEAASRLPRVPPRELEARRLFYAAERDFGKPESMADAAARYRTLLETYADTTVVKGELARVKARAEAGKEYLLSAYQLRGTGTFGLAAAPRSEAAWTSKSDVDGAQAVGNYVEAEFTALAGQSYKCWALIGACCAETFTFYLQATDGTDFNTKTKQKESIEPGAGSASVVKHWIKDLARSHRSHVTKIAKAPIKWEWIAIPLPKVAAPGLKKIRLISDQQGFSVGAVLVSSTRTAPPADAEVKEEAGRAKASLAERGLSLENPGEKAWKPLFNGKTKECLRSDGPGWKIEEGKLVAEPGVNNAAQTSEDFTDGSIRVRFEGQELTRIWFNFRQGSGGGYGLNWENDLKSLEGRPHDLIYTAKGDQVTATLDGKPVPVNFLGPASSGCLQFNGNGKRFAVLSLDFRP